MSDLMIQQPGHRGGQEIFTLPVPLPAIIYRGVSGGGTMLCQHTFHSGTVEYNFSHLARSLHPIGNPRDTVLVYSFSLRCSPLNIKIENTFALVLGESITPELVRSHAELTLQQYHTQKEVVLLQERKKPVFDIPYEVEEMTWGD
jgi:hypothetical protein